jgi:exodeoxyribonuclease VII large subunit
LDKTVYSVKQLSREIRNLLESSYRTIWIEGELSGVSTPHSGHIYFSLKEDKSLLRCAFFKNRQSRNTCNPVDGMQVLVQGQISYYEARGDLQLIVTYMEESGEGALQRAFEALKKKLASEGLFEQSNKQPIPAMPNKIGLITSAGSAALQDMLVTLKRRYPVAGIVVYPTLVQGPEAPGMIVESIRIAQQRAETDVLILARGGGSMEDLQAFNDERVARAIFHSDIPMVCAVGHETDFSIADFVADQRAPTPTAAAELVTPDYSVIRQDFSLLQKRIMASRERYIRDAQQSLDYLSSRLVHPSAALALVSQKKAYLSRQIGYLMGNYLSTKNMSLESCQRGLLTKSPDSKLSYYRQQMHGAGKSLVAEGLARLSALRQSVIQNQEKLTLMNPANTLERGYAIVQDSDNRIVTSTLTVTPGKPLNVIVADGSFGVKAD